MNYFGTQRLGQRDESSSIPSQLGCYLLQKQWKKAVGLFLEPNAVFTVRLTLSFHAQDDNSIESLRLFHEGDIKGAIKHCSISSYVLLAILRVAPIFLSIEPSRRFIVSAMTTSSSNWTTHHLPSNPSFSFPFCVLFPPSSSPSTSKLSNRFFSTRFCNGEFNISTSQFSQAICSSTTTRLPRKAAWVRLCCLSADTM